jgi:FdhD protein
MAGDSMLNGLPPATRAVPRHVWRNDWHHSERAVAEEAAVALTYDGTTYGVMMASPVDLEDFAYGFSLTEGIIAQVSDIEALEVSAAADGIDLRIWLRPERGDALAGRRRRLTGPVGCGLCGVESLRQASRPVPVVRTSYRANPATIAAALAALAPAQALNQLTGSVHAAGFWRDDLVALREDVGRHNALDKLAGALAQQAIAPAEGMLLMTSRLSVELVQKAAMMGCGILLAISAPTGLALRTAEAAGLTLVGVARADGFEVFTHPERIVSL